MFPNEKARLMRMMDSYGIPVCNEAGMQMDFTQRVTWLIEHANQQSVQADLLPCGHSSDNLGNFGGCNPMGSCVICDAATSR